MLEVLGYSFKQVLCFFRPNARNSNLDKYFLFIIEASLHNMGYIIFMYPSTFYITTKKNNSLPRLCQLSLFSLRYSYATRFGSHTAIIRRYNI
jgi:hypothetical protein